MDKRYRRWILFIVLFFIVGWGGTLVLGRDDSAPVIEGTVEPDRTRVVLPAITPAPTESSVGWETYWQNPSDDVPTIVHESCPQSGSTETEYRIQPGQRFLARVSTCGLYQGREVIEVKLQPESGSTVRGYVVRFDSFEAKPAE